MDGSRMPAAFMEPTERAPLILIINEDMEALREFRRALTKKNTEQEVQRKVNKYTSHIAFHLYQMYQATQSQKEDDIDAADARRREEIRRVAMTMIKLMEVARVTCSARRVGARRFTWISTTSWLPGVLPRWSLYQRRPGTLRHRRPSRSPLSVGRNTSCRPASSMVSR